MFASVWELYRTFWWINWLQYMFSSLFEYVCYIIFWIFFNRPPWLSLQLVFHILPMTNIVPWPPSHILDLFWRLVSASGRRYHNISVGICLWKLKIILENKILCPTCHVFLLSPICHFWMIDTLLQNMSQGRSDQTLCHQTRAPISHLTNFTHPQRETEIFHKIFQKYLFCVSQAVTHVSNSEFCKNIYKHLTRQNWLTNWYQHSTTLHSRQT